MTPNACYEKFTGHYVSTETLREVVKQTPQIPHGVADLVLTALETKGAIKGEFTDCMLMGMVLGDLLDQRNYGPIVKASIKKVAAWINDLDRLPIIKRPGDRQSGNN